MIVIANWKMNKNKTEVNLFMNEFSNQLNQIENLSLNKTNILFSPSFPFLSELQSTYSDTFSFVAQIALITNTVLTQERSLLI